MNSISSIIRILTDTDSRLLMTQNEYIAEIAAVIPFFLARKEIVQGTYRDYVAAEFKKMNAPAGVNITDDYYSDTLENDSIAYYRIRGMVTADSSWRFSSKQLQKDILAADENPGISAHFFHISSGGGEAWYMDQLTASMRALKKPTFAFIEKIAASAGYYIASQTSHISSSTPFDMIGCIGIMVGFMNLQPMFEKWGIKFIEEYATLSDLKNKKYNDLRTGNPKQFIEEELNPLRDRFVADVKSMRPVVAGLPEDHPALRGETFYADQAQTAGLIDVVEPISDALLRAHAAGVQWSSTQNQRRQAIQYLKR